MNDAHLAGDDACSTTVDTSLSVAAPGVLTNHSDADGDPLDAVLVSEVANGFLTLNADGSFFCTPAVDYSGPDGAAHKASGTPAQSNVATVSITVNPVNDALLAAEDAGTVTQGLH